MNESLSLSVSERPLEIKKDEKLNYKRYTAIEVVKDKIGWFGCVPFARGRAHEMWNCRVLIWCRSVCFVLISE